MATIASDPSCGPPLLPRTGIVSVELLDIVLDDSMARSREENGATELSSFLPRNPLLRHGEFRKLLEARLDEYAATPKLQQPLVTLDLLEIWRSKSPGGRFLKFDSQKRVWNDVGDKKALGQISKALKILVKEFRQSSTSSSMSRPSSESEGDSREQYSSRNIRLSISQQGSIGAATGSSSLSTSFVEKHDLNNRVGIQDGLIPSPPKRSMLDQTKRTISSFIRQKRGNQRLYSRSADHELLVQLYQQSISRPINDGPLETSNQSTAETKVLIISGTPGVGKTSLAFSLESRVVSHNGFFVRSKFSEVRPQQEPLARYKSILQDIVRIILDRKNNPKLQEMVCRKIVSAAGEEMELLTNVVPFMHQVEQLVEAANQSDPESYSKDHRPPRNFSLESPKSLIRMHPDQAFTPRMTHAGGEFPGEQATAVPGHGKSSVSSTEIVGTKALSVRRFVYAFQKVLKAVSSPEHPLVILLDDFHASDSAKTHNVKDQAVELASSARSSGGLFFIITYRLDPDHLSESTEGLNELLQEPLPNIRQHHLQLVGLAQDALQELLVDALSLEASKLEVLTRTVSDLTQGNVLFVLEILRAFQDDDLLRYDESQHQWVCDDHLIRQHPILQVSSLRDLYRVKILDMPSKFQEVLKACACLGPEFRYDVLKQAVEDADAVDTTVQTAQDRGFLSTYDSQGFEYYFFCHDSMHQAAYHLIPHDKRESWHLKIGQTLWNKAVHDEKLLESFLFVIMEQLFAGESLIKDMQDRINVASLCLHAGESMAKTSAFEMSAIYSLKGIGLLSRTKWRKQNTYDLCLALFNNAIDTCYATGRIDRVPELVKEVRENARVFEDEIRARIILIYTLGTRQDLASALELGVETLARLGEKLSRYPSNLQVWLEMAKTRRLLRYRSDTLLQRLPALTDERLISIQLVLNVMWLSAYYSQPGLAAMISCRMVQLSVDHGVSNVSCVGFAMFGTIILRGGMNLEEAKRYTELAYHLAGRFGGETWYSRIAVALYGVVNIWLEPMPHCLEKLKQAYQIGLGGGDMGFAMVNANIYLWNNIDRLPFSELEAHARNLMERMKFLGQEKSALRLLPLCQFCRSFMGQPDATNPAGDVVWEKSDIDHQAFHQGAMVGPDISNYYKMIVAYHFSDFVQAVSYAHLVRPMYLSLGTVLASCGRLYEALSLLETLHSQSTWIERLCRLRRIREHIHMFRYWSQHCPENFMGKLCLIQAELARYQGKIRRAQSKFYCAILHARDGGIVLEQALANERAGKYHLELPPSSHNNHGDGDDNTCHTDAVAKGTEYLQEAIRLYRECGGMAKVHHLIKEVGHRVHLQV